MSAREELSGGRFYIVHALSGAILRDVLNRSEMKPLPGSFESDGWPLHPGSSPKRTG